MVAIKASDEALPHLRSKSSNFIINLIYTIVTVVHYTMYINTIFAEIKKTCIVLFVVVKENMLLGNTSIKQQTQYSIDATLTTFLQIFVEIIMLLKLIDFISENIIYFRQTRYNKPLKLFS